MSFLSQLLPSKSFAHAKKIPGGITPAGFKRHSLKSRIMPMPLPPELWLSLKQRDGQELKATVKAGNSVAKNQLIAVPTTEFGVPLYAPSSGVIKEITPKRVASQFDEEQLHIVIAVDGRNQATQLKPVKHYQSLSGSELTETLGSLGVSGMGGADFPTTIKLQLANQLKTELLIINGAECEPFISADEALLRERAKQIVLGAKILLQACGAKDWVIAIEDNKHESIAALRQALVDEPAKLVLLKSKYPAGGERQVIQAVTGLEVPAAGLPADIGVLVQNVGTAYAAYDAIINGQPCISRITTLAGTPLKTPKNLEVLLGTPIPFLLDICGNDPLQQTGTIVGGSLMGQSLFDENVAASRICNCIIAKSEEWFPKPPPELACIRCGVCADACPASLLPQQLYAFSRNRDMNSLTEHSLGDCIECGACSYVCPSKIPLVQYFRASKWALKEDEDQFRVSGYWQQRYEHHQNRIEQDRTRKVKSKLRDSAKKATGGSDGSFSRSNAKAEIAAAVSRVKKRRSANKQTNSSTEKNLL